MKKIFAFLLFIVLLSSCAKKITSVSTFEQSDSTRVDSVVSYVDTTVVVPADSSVLTAVVVDGELPEVKVVTGRSRIKVSVKKGELKAECYCDSLEKEFKILQTKVKQTNVKKEKKSEHTVDKVNYLTWWQKLLMWIGVVALLFVAGMLVKKFYF
jgi:hypothetical protein